jgi:N-acetyl-gamma-glutamyl-phosphate reductase
MKNKIRVGIVGGAGYTGGEAIRLLLHHRDVALHFVHSRSNAGKHLHVVHPDLLGETDLCFSDVVADVDVLFLCLGHGESKKFMEGNVLSPKTKVIDLSQDFRLGEKHEGNVFVYGLPELNRDAIKKATHVANPGCFATAIQLGLLPFAQKGLLGEVYTTGITGSTGAGQKLQDTTHFSWRANNISAYKTLNHQHLSEIKQSLKQLQSNFDKAINFVPWRGDFTRGIFVSSCLSTSLSKNEVISLYKDFYSHHPFTHVSDTPIHLKQVVNTNKCLLHIEQEGDKVVIHSAIDNLLKGAAGQAVQNMNLLFDLDEKAGLYLKSTTF